MRILDESEHIAQVDHQWPEGWSAVLTHTHTYSGQSDHGGTTVPPESYRRLAEWAGRCGIAALGMGSPYTPKSAETYGRCEGVDRDRYYGGQIDPRSVLDQDEIESMLAQVNAASAGRTLFYLDNETPKGRYGHLWWVGYRQVVPAWHDYDQPYDRWLFGDARAGVDGDEPMPYERRPYLQILAEQRAWGALGFWAHPTSWWPESGGQFVTNIAAEMPVHAIAEGRLDGLVVMGYAPYRPEYQAIWFELLDRGYRVPGVAEMDCGLSEPNLWARESPLLTYAWLPERSASAEDLAAAFRTGRMFASSGPFVNLEVDGHPMGSVAPTSDDRAHEVIVTAYPRSGGSTLDRVELIGPGGQVVWSRDGFPGGTIGLQIGGLAQRGYLVARAVSEDQNRKEWRQPSQVAIGNPVYLHPPGCGFEPPGSTLVEFEIPPTSPFHGGELRFESVRGEVLGTAKGRGTIAESLPSTGRVTLVAPDSRTRTDYLINANPALQAVERYLYRGRFLRDFPSAKPGEVPVEAWRLDRFVEALRGFRLTY